MINKNLFILKTILISILFISTLYAKQTNFKVAIDQNYTPFTYVNKKGESHGFYVELWEQWAKVNNYSIEFVNSDWVQSVDNVKNKKADFHASVYSNEDGLFSSKPIHAEKISLFVLREKKLKSIDQLFGKKVGVIDPVFGQKLKIQFPKINIVVVDNYNSLLSKLLNGELAALFDTKLAVQVELLETQQTHLFSTLKLGMDVTALARPISYSKDLIKIFEKGWENVTIEQKLQIEEKWIINVDDRTFSQEEEHKVNLTNEEQEWIKNNTVKVGVEQWTPVVYSNTGKDIDGITGDILKLVIKNSGLKVEIINDLWDPLLKGLKDKKIDLLPATYYTDERATYGLYTDSYYKMMDYIYTKDDNYDIKSMKDLEGKKVAIQKGYGSIPKIREKFPSINIIETKDLTDSINKVLLGEVDALYEGQIAVEYKIQEGLITGLKGIPQSDFKAAGLHFFIRDDKPILQSILQKGLKSITFEQMREVKSKWVNNKGLKLTKKEQQWLDKNKVIKYVYDPDWAPFEWKNEVNNHSGIISDILKLVSAKSGIKLEATSTDTWKESTTKAKNREVDMYSAITKTDKRAQYMNFTNKSIYELPYVFIVREDDEGDYFETFKSIKNKKVATVEGYALYDILKKDFPKLPLLTTKSVKDGLSKLQNKELDIFIVNAATAQYYIKRLGFDDLKITTKIEYKLDLKIAVRNDWPDEVISILDKALSDITEKELDDIYYKWTVLNEKQKIDWTLLLEITGGVSLIVLFLLYNNRMLKQNVEEKTQDILKQKLELEDLSKNLEKKVEEQTKDLKKQLRIGKMADRKQQELVKEIKVQKEFTQTLLDSQEQLIITTNGKVLLTANETFFDFFAVDSAEDFMDTYDAKCICDKFNTQSPEGYLQIKMGRETWIEYVLSRSFDMHKAMISVGSNDFIFSVTAAKLPGDKGMMSAVFTNITEMENAKLEIEAIHKHTRESIEYASLIQNSLIPDNKTFKHFFEDYFAIWQPKDIVGGDIYLMEQVSEDEVILMIIDCTGHGVPGAFVTMLVKAVERQLMANIHKDEVISPAKILKIFNRSIKHLLKQESEDSISNAGFDGGIIYYNKKEKIIKFAGAETALFYIDNDELKTIKGNRHSVGYKKSDANYEFTDHTVEVREGMKFYCATDGFLDQNGGEKGFPFSKKRFSNLLKENYNKTFSEQKNMLFDSLKDYQGSEDRNDDVTVIGFEI